MNFFAGAEFNILKITNTYLKRVIAMPYLLVKKTVLIELLGICDDKGSLRDI